MNCLLQMIKEDKFPLIMSLPANNPEWAKAAWDNGADVVKIHINVSHHASQTLFGSFEEEKENIKQMLADAKGPMGIVLGIEHHPICRDFKEAILSGFDFISLYGHNTPLEVLQNKAVSKMLAPDYTWKDWEISLLDQIGCDILEASVMHPDTYGQALNARDIIQYRHISQLSSLPIVLPTQRAVEAHELEILQKNGIDSIMLGAMVTGKTTEGIAAVVAKFRKEIDRLKG